MRRFFVSDIQANSQTIELGGDSFHHICGVCRNKVGDRFELLPGDGKAYLVEITDLQKKIAICEVKDTRELAPLKKPYIHLVVSLPKYATMDAIVEKSVELGVHSIYPVVSDFSFIGNKAKVPSGKIARWEKILEGASAQTGRGEKMHLMPLATLDEFFSNWTNRQSEVLGLFAYEGKSTLDIRSFLRDAPRAEVSDIFLFVGSEGGFSEAEVEKFQQVRLQPVTLGEQVLRVETACVALTSVLKYEFGLMA